MCLGRVKERYANIVSLPVDPEEKSILHSVEKALSALHRRRIHIVIPKDMPFRGFHRARKSRMYSLPFDMTSAMMPSGEEDRYIVEQMPPTSTMPAAIAAVLGPWPISSL